MSAKNPPRKQSSAQESKSRQREPKDPADALRDIPVTDVRIHKMFRTWEPDAEQEVQDQHIREAASALAQVIRNNTRAGEHQREAIRKVREAAAWARFAIQDGGE